MVNADVAAPQWFTDALATPVETGSFECAGVSIAYRAWGERGLPGLVLVHGGMAHSHWWDHIGPQLSHRRRVVALDMAGHGDSDHRETYTMESSAREVIDVAAAAGIVGKPILVGHSLGGIVSFTAAAQYGDELDGVIILDSPLRELTPEEREMRQNHGAKPHRVYENLEDAVARFRLVPAQDDAEPYVFDHIARTSLRETEGGWTWKFDATRAAKSKDRNLTEMTAGCRVAYFRSENGIISDELMSRMVPMFGDDPLVVELPSAGHHPLVDQSLVVVTAVRTVLAAWS